MTPLSLSLLALLGLSTAAMLVGLAGYNGVRKRHARFLETFDDSSEKIPSKRSNVLLWVYVLSTTIITIAIIVLFVLQPITA